jgi:7-carboxy-7-deazaguanine synthase
MTRAKVSEIFVSYQGEGPFVGSRQLFIRFYGCNMNCVYCDTVLKSYKSFTAESLLGKVLDFDEAYNELVLTGGEPLVVSDFLKEFLPAFRAHRENHVYLETNGTLPRELEKIIDLVDIIAMDIKLPSSTGHMFGLWKDMRAFAEIAERKELIMKAVITDSTHMDDVKKMGSMISALKKKHIVVLQPVTPVSESVKEPDEEMIQYFKKYLEKETGKDVMIFGQVHKLLGIK